MNPIRGIERIYNTTTTGWNTANPIRGIESSSSGGNVSWLM